MLTLRISPVPARTHCTRGCLCIYPLALSGVARLGRDILGDFLCFLCGKGWTGGILVTSIVSNGKGGCVNQGSHNDSKGVNIELPVLPALSISKLEVRDPTCWYSVPSSKSLMMKRHSSSLEIRNQLSVILNIRASAPPWVPACCAQTWVSLLHIARSSSLWIFSRDGQFWWQKEIYNFSMAEMEKLLNCFCWNNLFRGNLGGALWCDSLW